MTTTTHYAMQATLNVPYTEAVERAKTELKAEGFGVLTEIDMRSTMKQKLDADFRNYVILGACNPQLAHQALSKDLAIGLLLPCNVIVYEEGNGSVISIVDPDVMLGVAEAEALQPIADEARRRLQRVHAKLSQS